MAKKTSRQRYKGFGEKPNPKKQAELKNDATWMLMMACPFHKECQLWKEKSKDSD